MTLSFYIRRLLLLLSVTSLLLNHAWASPAADSKAKDAASATDQKQAKAEPKAAQTEKKAEQKTEQKIQAISWYFPTFR